MQNKTSFTTYGLWAVFIALLAALLPHTAWAFRQYEPMESQVLIGSTTNGDGMRVGASPNAVNYVFAVGNATGVAPSLAAQGSDTDVDLSIGGKGNGVVNFDNAKLTPSAGTLVGFVTFKLNGVSYKIPYHGVV